MSFGGPFRLRDRSGVITFEGESDPPPGGGSQPGALASADLLLTEEEYVDVPLAITDYNGGYFVVAGDQTERFPGGATFSVTGSTDNDGDWTVDHANFAAGSTTITTSVLPTSETVDGTIHAPNFYTATFDVAERAVVLDMIVYGLGAPWGGPFAYMDVGDSDADDVYFGDVDLVNSLSQYGDDLSNPQGSYYAMQISGGNGQDALCGYGSAGGGDAGPGKRYAAADTITARAVVSQSTNPPQGITLIKVIYFTAATETDAVVS